jgi:hypothetical protein
VGEITTSKINNMKELRPGSTGRSEIRILFLFDPWQQFVLPVAGDKAGEWSGWYRHAIPRAEELYAEHVEAMGSRGDGGRWCAGKTCTTKCMTLMIELRSIG